MTSSTVAAAPPPRRRARNLVLMIALALIVILIVGSSLWVWGTLGYTYSSGERTGYVQKLSHKGWLCKTWEGELAMNPVVGSPPQIFDFTVRNDSLAGALELASGKQVTLDYAQHKGVPGTCFGETEYYIQNFRVAGGR